MKFQDLRPGDRFSFGTNPDEACFTKLQTGKETGISGYVAVGLAGDIISFSDDALFTAVDPRGGAPIRVRDDANVVRHE